MTATLTGVMVAASAGAMVWVGSASAATTPGVLFRDPESQAVRWLAANPNDSRAGVIRDRIASQPNGRWFTTYQPNSVTSEVAGFVGKANAAGSVPLLVMYALPNRDCGGASAGGAPDIASYKTWAQQFAKGLGSRRAIVIVEPDALALQTCLDDSKIAERDGAVAFAAKAIKDANPAAKVYLDGGHSNWNSPDEQARRLVAAGVKTSADGFYTNASNFRRTADEVAYGKAVLTQLNAPQLHFVVDTSRNGSGSLGDQWCDPAGRAIGEAPTLNTGDPAVDAFLWIKPPGEADGCQGGAGTFSPDVAYQLATNGSPAQSQTATSPAPSQTASSPAPSQTATSLGWRSLLSLLRFLWSWR
ncbi:glycoside hydrolase family 6 protein [Dactylosporangium sp. NPDC049525]|uniref:glycoside hydrolase family 6 protein n=1 Tax=Dactylosporangium sp. NPDC049525 TaxID=3154730 RepID=UPI0034378D8F